MSIEDFHHGDITALENDRDIIIGMNTKLAEASVIGRRVLTGKYLASKLELGDVITFKFDDRRSLHMLICHELCLDGWEHADQYVRFGLDYLWQRLTNPHNSIVRIGTGPVGIRDGAHAPSILKAMAESYLPLHLYLWEGEQIEARVAQFPPLVPIRAWSFERGEREIRVAA